MSHKFRELLVWKRAMRFTADIYRFSQCFPHTEQFGLTSQIRRATTAIALNIAEGAGNASGKEFARFLHIALRSTYETMTAIELAILLNYADQTQAEALLNEADQIAAMLSSLAKKVQQYSDARLLYELAEAYDVDI